MNQEIERKFLVSGSGYKELAVPTRYKQGYITITEKGSVRVRIAGEKAFLTVKSKRTGISRAEYEYEIPVAEAQGLLTDIARQPIIEKQRYKVEYAGNIWEVDEFFGDNEGLVIAEIELESEDQRFEKPEWIGEEVSGERRYYNANLVGNPYCNWNK